jgi:hypothetical protein
MAAVIGIDPGTHTGVAVYRDGQLTICEAMGAHDAFDLVRQLAAAETVMVVYEDARLIGGIGGARAGSRDAAARAQGAGSVKRDSALWFELLEKLGCSYHRISPRAKGGKLTRNEFKALTKWDAQTNQHGRDAAMIAWTYRNWRNS